MDTACFGSLLLIAATRSAPLMPAWTVSVSTRSNGPSLQYLRNAASPSDSISPTMLVLSSMSIHILCINGSSSTNRTRIWWYSGTWLKLKVFAIILVVLQNDHTVADEDVPVNLSCEIFFSSPT